MAASARESALRDLASQAGGCVRCPKLAAGRTSVVFGAGNAGAELMFVGEAPGATEDREGLPFVGASGKLLDGLLDGIGLTREEVFITSVLKCRPPDNRDPRPDEIRNCSPWLEGQLEIIEPSVVVTLGNFATRLLRGSNDGIGTVHGQEEIVQLGMRQVRLYPVFHPAAALYRRPNLAVLEEDFARIPGLIEKGPPDQLPAGEDVPVEAGQAAAADGAGVDAGKRSAGGDDRAGEPEEAPAGRDDQLGLF